MKLLTGLVMLVSSVALGQEEEMFVPPISPTAPVSVKCTLGAKEITFTRDSFNNVKVSDEGAVVVQDISGVYYVIMSDKTIFIYSPEKRIGGFGDTMAKCVALPTTI